MKAAELNLIKSIIKEHPQKTLILKYLEQQQSLYGDNIYLNLTKQEYLKLGLLKYFPILRMTNENTNTCKPT